MSDLPDPLETANIEPDSAASPARARLQNLVAVTVALIATFLAVCNVKDGNIVQAMQQAQADKIDHWSFYQARNIREEIAKTEVAQLQITSATSAAGAARTKTEQLLATYTALAQEQHVKKDSLRVQAEGDQRTYDALNVHDDQFDLAEAMLSLAVSLLAVTALTGRRWLYFAALVPTAFGGVMGLAGLCGWGLHSDWFAKLLS